jgi:phosphoribosylformylglycinamidine synthase
VAALLHDRMTESCCAADDAAGLFRELEARPLETVDVIGSGKAALERPTPTSAWPCRTTKIEYLDAAFTKAGRNPTDVELMMFAQANSEHCRHKIFNADWTIDGVAQPNRCSA